MVFSRSLVVACLCAAACPAAAQTSTSSTAGAPAPTLEQPPPTSPPEVSAPDAVDTPEDAAEGWGDLAETVSKVFDTRLYGYIDAHIEQVADTPSGVGATGNTEYEANPLEIDVLNLHVMVQGTILSRFRYFVNLVGSAAGSPTGDAGISVRNAWLEAPILGDALQARLGKTYRRFGLYNEVLDAVPTFIGIEAPELFDKDHLLLTRTTNAMLHGRFALGVGSLAWSLTTGADERASDQIPLGGDLRLVADVGFTVGSSFYWTGGDAAPSREVGDGSPAGGVINWMERDEYYVVGGYAQWQAQGLTLQAEYWQAHHDATRSEEGTAALADANLLPAQRGRFFVNGDPAQGLQPRDVTYDVRTFYLRGGYDISVADDIVLTPYAQLDYYANPETINAKSFGGDAEAGNTDDGEFWKFTVGAVFRPVAPVALKVDGSGHLQQFNGKSEFYPELRVSLSYLWEL
jgi:hypothetical protein